MNNVKKLVFLGTSCVYPRECPQPMKEKYLMTGPLEPTNEAYALAKIAGFKMIEFYRKQHGFNGISVMPCNLYGPNDNFDPRHSHVMSALIRKFVEAKEKKKEQIIMWGTGKAKRELMHVNDAARAIVFLMEIYNKPSFVNIGTGTDISIKDLAKLIAKKVNFNGKILWDTTKPDGMPRKCLDVKILKSLDFKHKIEITKGIDMMIKEYKRYKKR